MTTHVMSHDIFTPRLTSAVNVHPTTFNFHEQDNISLRIQHGQELQRLRAELENFSRKQLDAAQEEGRKRAKADKMASIRAQEASTRRIEDLQMQLTGVHKKLEEALMDKAAANRAALAAEDNAYGLQQQWDSCKEVGCFT